MARLPSFKRLFQSLLRFLIKSSSKIDFKKAYVVNYIVAKLK